MKVLSLGAGVQSTVLALMVARGELEADHIIFADPGNESKATYEHVEWLKVVLADAGCDFRIVSAGNIYKEIMDVVEGKNVPQRCAPPFMTKTQKGIEIATGPLLRKCTKEYKITPVDSEIRKILGLKKHQRFPKDFECITYLGISLDEVQRMKPSREWWKTHSWPLIDLGMTRWDCYRWLEKNKYPIPPKSSCIICPFHDDATWREMKLNSPEEFEQACKLDDAIRTNIPGVKGDVFLHSKCVPLREYDFSSDTDRGQGLLFNNECEGYCGI